jgi:hypothetical protein
MTVEAALLDWIGNRRRRCSVGEAAAGTGLSLQEVEPGLLALVADVSGRLQVAEDGTLLFVFPAALRMRLLALSGAVSPPADWAPPGRPAGAAPRVRQRLRPVGADHRRPGPRAPADRLNPSTLATAAGSRRFARRGAAWSGTAPAATASPASEGPPSPIHC